MRFTFDEHGRIAIAPDLLLDCIDNDCRGLVDSVLFRATPQVFESHESYSQFAAELGRLLHVHPRNIVLRGSALLSYSVTPRAEKAWKAFRRDACGEVRASDIDVAIIDVDFFERMDAEVRRWESRQHTPSPGSQAARLFGRRGTLRTYNCVFDRTLPPNVCQAHCDAVAGFDTEPFLGTTHELSCFIFRDWWSARNRSERDLRELAEAVRENRVAHPSDLAADSKTTAENESASSNQTTATKAPKPT